MAGRAGRSRGRGQKTRGVSGDRHHKRRDVRVRAQFRAALGRVQLGLAFPVVHARRVRPAGRRAGVQDAGDGGRAVRHGQIVLLPAGRLRRADGSLGRRKPGAVVQG